MARPKKTGLDYFPLDVDLFSDDKFVEVAAEHGSMEAGYIVTRLLCELYRVGYCYRWSGKTASVFAFKIGVAPELAASVVDGLLDAEFFNKEIYKAHGVLTSKGIQRRFLHITRGRVECEIKDSYSLLNEKKVKESKVKYPRRGGRMSVSDIN